MRLNGRSSDIFVKEYKIKINYYLNKIIKNWSNILPYFIFGLSILSSLALIVCPNILHIYPIYSEEYPIILDLSGTILINQTYNSDTSLCLNPLPGAKIEIGGYNCWTDQEGRYRIKFLSDSSTDIPIIISFNNNVTIKRITFDKNDFKKEEMFTLDGIRL